MKSYKSVLAIVLIALFISSCSTSDKVVTGNYIQKRKYTKGYHLNKQKRNNKGDFFANSSKSNSDEKRSENRHNTSEQKTSKDKYEKSKTKKVDKDVIDKTLTSDSEESIVIEDKKRPAYFDNTIRDRVEKRVGNSKNRVQKKLKKNLAKIKNYGAKTSGTKTDGLAVAGFVLSILGLIVAGIIFGLLAIIFGGVALGRINKSDGAIMGKGFATAAIIIGIIDIVAVLILLSTL